MTFILTNPMQTLLKSITARSLMIVLVILLLSCDNGHETESTLRADFETDDVGFLSDKTLPGLPGDDELVYSTTNTLETVHSPFLVSSGCEDTFFNGDDRFTVDNPVNTNIVADPSDLIFNDYLLRATFEGDAIGGLPDNTLPDVPVGDKLKYADADRVLVVRGHQQQQKAVSLFSTKKI
jgi:hypothetical protein